MSNFRYELFILNPLYVIPVYFLLPLIVFLLVSYLVYRKTKDDLLVYSTIWFCVSLFFISRLIFKF